MENINNTIVPETPIQPIETPITPEPISTPPKSNLFKYLFIISIVVLLIVITSFIFVLNNKNTKQSPVEQNNISQTTPTLKISPQPTTVVSPNINQDQSINWNTYTNTQYNFSLKYPSEWKITQTQGGDGGSLLNLVISPVTDLPQFSKNNQPNITVAIRNYQGSFMDWLKSGKDGFDIGSFIQSSSDPVYVSKTETINGYQAYYYKQTSSSYIDEVYAISNNKGNYLEITFRESDKHYSTNGTVDQSNDFTQYLPLFNQIVNSIQF